MLKKKQKRKISKSEFEKGVLNVRTTSQLKNASKKHMEKKVLRILNLVYTPVQ